MDIGLHCHVCNNKSFDPQTGVYCSLTNAKPNFDSKCDKIILGKFFYEHAKEIHGKYELLKSKKNNYIIAFALYLFLALLVFFADYYWTQVIYNKGYVSTVTIAIAVPGLALIGLAFGNLNYYLRNIRVAKLKIDELKQITDLYNLQYTINTRFYKEAGEKKVEIALIESH